MPTQANLPEPIEQAGLALREVLLRLDAYSKKRVQTINTSSRYADSVMNHVRDLDALMVAVQGYEEAVLACLPSVNSGEDHIYEMSAAELLAYRQADPVYRLGWVRGHKAGVAQAAQQARERARSFSTGPAVLPVRFDCSFVVKRLRLLLDFWRDPAPLSLQRLNTLRQQVDDCYHNTSNPALYGTV